MKRRLRKPQVTPFKRLALLIVFSCASTAANAVESVGKITAYHLNGDIADRGVCIQMNPALPGIWVCLFKSNPLYKELTALLLAGHAADKTCKVGWTATGTWAEIRWAECN
jgi:hypothetical protein